MVILISIWTEKPKTNTLSVDVWFGRQPHCYSLKMKIIFVEVDQELQDQRSGFFLGRMLLMGIIWKGEIKGILKNDNFIFLLGLDQIF